MDERDKQERERLARENKELRNSLTKREFEMKELVRTLKFYSEEKMRLEKEVEKLNRENDQLVGHKNPSQKIQHHVKIKEENNKLREENVRLQEELHRKLELIQKKGTSVVEQAQSQPDLLKEDLKKLKKENQACQESLSRLADHVFTQPVLLKAIGLSEDLHDKLL